MTNCKKTKQTKNPVKPAAVIDRGAVCDIPETLTPIIYILQWRPHVRSSHADRKSLGQNDLHPCSVSWSFWMQMHWDLNVKYWNVSGDLKWPVISEGPEFKWSLVILTGDHVPVLFPLPLDLTECEIKQNRMACTLMSCGIWIQFGSLSLGSSLMHILKISHDFGL